MKGFTVELTTHKKILEVNNTMCHNYYYVQYGRIYNAEHTRFRRFKFVVWFDIYDVMEYFEKESVSKQEVAEYSHVAAWGMSEALENDITSFDDCEAFRLSCNETINDYNRICR